MLKAISQTWLDNMLYLLIFKWTARCWSLNPNHLIVPGWTYKQQMALQGFKTDHLKNAKKGSHHECQFDASDFYVRIHNMKESCEAKINLALNLVACEDEPDAEERLGHARVSAERTLMQWEQRHDLNYGPLLLDTFMNVHNVIYPFVLKSGNIHAKNMENNRVNQGHNWKAYRIDKDGKRLEYLKSYDVNRWQDPNKAMHPMPQQSGDNRKQDADYHSRIKFFDGPKNQEEVEDPMKAYEQLSYFRELQRKQS